MNENDLNQLRVNFNLEVLHGCKWSCVGCYVDTKSQEGFKAGDISRFQGLSSSFKEKGLIPSILILGPTDVFTASNSLELLQNDDFYELSRMYERLTLTTTFMEIDDGILEMISRKFSHMEVEFKIIIDLPLFNDDAHLLKVQSNMRKTEKALANCKLFVVHPQLNLFNAPIEIMRKTLTNYVSINNRSYSFFGQGVDYAVSFGRRDISKKYQRKAFQLLKDIFNSHISSEDDGRSVHFDAGRMNDIQENIFTYKNGKFFFAPKLYDEYVNFYDRYEIQVATWKADEFIQFQKKLLLDQYSKIDDYPCGDCAYAGNCVSKGVVDFLEFIQTKQCIFPRAAFKAINAGVPDGSLEEEPL